MFLDSFKKSLKVVLLNIKCSPMLHTVHLKEIFENIELLSKWNMRGTEYGCLLWVDLKVIGIVLRLWLGYSKL